MKTRDTIVWAGIFLIAFLAWVGTQQYLAKKHPEWFAKQEPPAATQPAVEPTATSAGATGVNPSTAPVAVGPGVPSSNPTSAGEFEIKNAPADELSAKQLGSNVRDDAQFALHVQLNPTAGSIDAITLNNHNQSLDPKNPKNFKPYVFQSPNAEKLDETRVLATRSVTINGKKIDLSQSQWNADRSGNSATYSIDLASADGQSLKLVKRYEVFERKDEAQGGGYEIAIKMSLVNTGKTALVTRTRFNGPTLPPREMDRGPDQHVVSAYNDEGYVKISYPLVEEFKKETPVQELVKKDMPILWAGISGVYFNAILRPEARDGSARPVDYISSVTGEWLNPGDNVDAEKRIIHTVFETTDLHLAPGETIDLPMRLFAGPRWRKLLDQPYYAAFPREYNKTLVMTSGACSICTFAWLINLLMSMLSFFHMIIRDWGLAIIALVLIVRTILHPITKKSQVNMAKMGKLGPEAERLKKKFGDDKDGLNKAMMELYKEQGFTPVLGCLPMFLQMPIWIALYSGLQSTFELRQAPLFYGLTWVRDLAKPDHLLTWQPVPLIMGMQLSALNILPILLAIVFYLNTKYTPKPPATSPEQEQQQKMMTWMSTLLFPLFLYNGPSGLNLYILTSTTVGIIESIIIRKHIREQEEASKGLRIVVDAKPTRASRVKDNTPKPQAPATGLKGFFQRLQQQAEEIQRQQNERNKKK